jgi:hypothetical protein
MLELIKYMQTNNKKTIDWDEYYNLFKEDFEWQKNIKVCEPHNFGSAKGHMLRKNQNILDYNKEIWNNPNRARSPFKYFEGLFIPIGLNKNKNMIYEYDNSYSNI